MGLYFVVAVVVFALAVVILSFVGPEQSEKPFWIAIQKIRVLLDRGSYCVICTIAILCILAGAALVVWSLLR